jgi:hypothetical protein
MQSFNTNISEIKWKIKNAEERIYDIKEDLKSETYILQDLESELKAEENKLLISKILDHEKFKNVNLLYSEKLLIAKAIDISSYSQYDKSNDYGDCGEKNGEIIRYPEYPVLFSDR